VGGYIALCACDECFLIVCIIVCLLNLLVNHELDLEQELKSLHFPFEFGSLKLNMFEPMQGAVCPLQKIAAFGSADDSRIAGCESIEIFRVMYKHNNFEFFSYLFFFLTYSVCIN
jgi:hypothetical protein